MPAAATPVKQVQYNIHPPKPATPRSPTMASLLNDPDRRGWVSITVPTVTRAYNINHQPICLNKRTFMPGQTYSLPPLIAAELRKSIENFEEKIVLQVTKGQGQKAGIPLLEINSDGSIPDSHVLQTLTD